MEEKKIFQQRDKKQRDFSLSVIEGIAAMGLAGMSTLGAAKEARACLPETQAQDTWKSWAQTYLKGVENETLPSFTPDFRNLSEAGIRLDVQQAIRHGFSSTLCTSEAGLSLEEAKDFVSIAAEEAGDQLLVSTTILFDSFDDSLEMLDHAAKAGCTHVLLGYPPNFYPQSVDEIWDRTREMIQAANIGIVLYPSPTFNFGRFAPYYGFPFSVLRKAVYYPNVIGIKVAGPLYNICYWWFRNRILLSNPADSAFVYMSQNYGQQWIGAGPYEYLQSPEKPYFVQMVNYCLEGRYEEAQAIQEFLQPASQSFMQRHARQSGGVYNWPEHKFYQWCTGGNGGYTRQPVMKISAATMNSIKQQYAGLNITTSTPE